MKPNGKRSKPYMQQGEIDDDLLSVRRPGIYVRGGFDRDRVVAPIGGASLTQQNFAPECDINNIMSRYLKTGIIEHVNRFQGRYEDLTETFDYQEAIERVRSADNAFSTLPAGLRSRFDNDPAKFLDFVTDPANLSEMQTLGLVPKGPEPSPKGDTPGVLKDSPEGKA